MAKKDDKIKIDFSEATSADEVVGSCYKMTVGKTEFLVDCGAYQGADVLTEYKVNNRRYKFSAKKLSYIFLTHAHYDHSGQIPKMVKDGFHGTIYVPKGSYRILKTMWSDCAYINEKNATYLSTKQGKLFKPIYTMDDVTDALSLVEEIPFGEEICIDENVYVKLYHAGHIIGSSQMVFTLHHKGYIKKVAFTGDIGNKYMDKHFVKPIEEISKCNVLIGETTYGNPSRHSVTMKDRYKDIEKIRTVVTKTCVEDKSKLIIPVFALDRCVEILTTLYEMYHEDKSFNIPILVDSKLGLNYIKDYFNILQGEELEEFSKVINWKWVNQIEEYTVSKSHQENGVPEIVLASSGMMNAGRSVAWGESFVSNQYAHFLFCGYSSENTLASHIKDIKCKYVKINDKTYRNRANVTTLNSFSSHASHDYLLEYYSKIDCSEKIILVHGDMDGKLKFADELKEEIGKKNRTTKVLVGNSSMIVSI